MLDKSSLKSITATCLLLAAPLAAAHEGMHVTGGFTDGFLHPLTGLDHLLVALAAGGWALHRERPVMLARLALFVGCLLCGMLLAGGGLATAVLPVAALAVLATAVVQPCRFPHALFAGCGLWHGVLHIQAMPAQLSLVFWVSGLLPGTALLIATGVFAWRSIRQLAVAQQGRGSTQN